MPARRRVSKRRGLGRDEIVERFTLGDGINHVLTFPPVFANRMIARSVWCEWRAEVWSERVWMLPIAASAYDGITDHTLEYRGHGVRRSGVGLFYEVDVEDVRRALAEDVASIERFREVEPIAARPLKDALEEYVADLRTVAAVLEGLADMEYSHAQFALSDVQMAAERARVGRLGA